MAITSSSTTSHANRILQPRRLWFTRALWIAGVALIALFMALCIAVEWHDMNTGVVQVWEGWTLNNRAYAIYVFILDLGLRALFFCTGLFLAWRRSDNWMTLALAAALMMLGLLVAGFNEPMERYFPGDEQWATFIQQLVTISDTFTLAMILLFPDGKWYPRWSWAVLPFYVVLLTLTRSHIIVDDLLSLLIDPGIILMGMVAQFFRYRKHSSLEQRLQTKWCLLGLTLAILAVLIFFGVASLLDPAAPNAPLILLASYTLMIAAAMFAPIAFLFALTRYRLYEVDLVINRSMVYGALTVGLGAVFLIGVLVVQNVLQQITGGEQSAVAIAISALAIGVLFQPTRRRLQAFVDKRLYHLRVGLDEIGRPLDRPKIQRPGALTGMVFEDVYEVADLLGRGGMGEVYRGVHRVLRSNFAIKALPRELADQPDFRARFEREAQIVAGLDHKNVIHVYRHGEVDGNCYMIMDYIDGQNLSEYLKVAQRLPEDEAVVLLGEIAEALHYAHQCRVIHRDIKPSNIMLKRETATLKHGSQYRTHRAILTDFGIARIVEKGDGRITRTGMLGTLDYAAPEQIMDTSAIDHRADIYALGVLAYELVTGELPFKGSAAQVVFAHLQQPPPDPREIVPTLSATYAHAVLRALCKDPDDRFNSAAEFATALTK
jgi:hypothetical protein